MSTVKVNAITDASGGNTATINSMTPTADSLQGFRNRLINGAMVIDQRNAGASVSVQTTTGYTLDRWTTFASQNSKFSIQQNAGSVTPPTGFSNYLGCTSSSAYSITSGDYFGIYQRIEGFNFADAAWGTANAKTITLSFWVRSSLTGTFGGAFRNNASDRGYPFTYTISSANTWEYKTITVVGDTTGTWVGATNGNAVGIQFSLGTGSSYSFTAGAWGNYSAAISATGATSVVGTNGATWYITGVQLEVGSTATPFERRPYGTELALCQRYFRKTLGATNTEPAIYAWGSSAQVVGQSWVYPTQMRASPTVTTEGTLAIANAATPTIVANETSYLLYVSPSSGTAGVISYQPNDSYKISFSAEL